MAQEPTGPAEDDHQDSEGDLEPAGTGLTGQEPDPSQADRKNDCVESILPLIRREMSRLDPILELASENRRLLLELRRIERELASRDAEIEKLRRELVYRERVFEKEMEDHEKIHDQRWAVLQERVGAQIDSERAIFHQQVTREQEIAEQRLNQERELAEEQLARAREVFEVKLSEASRREGLWSRLIKMMTWS